jgi:hypothetical protein
MSGLADRNTRRFATCWWRARRGSNSPEPPRQGGDIARCRRARFMEDRGGNDPPAGRLKVCCTTLVLYAPGPIGTRRLGRTIIARLSTACSWPLSYASMVGWCGFDPLPCGRVLRTRCRSHRLSQPIWPNPSGPTHLAQPNLAQPNLAQPNLAQPKMVPPLRIKLRSARYRRAALSLCYGGLAEPGRIERSVHCELTNRLRSRPQQVPIGGRRLVPTHKPFGLIPFRTEARGRPGSPSLCVNVIGWRSVIGIEPSAITGRPVLQTPLRSQPRHAPDWHVPIWRMTGESNSRPAGRIAFPARARSLPGMSSFYGTPGPIRTDTAWFLRPVPPTVGLLGQISVIGTIRLSTDLSGVGPA